MIWSPDRNRQQGQLVTVLYRAAEDLPCERSAVMAGGLPGADKDAALAAAGVDSSRYLTVSVDAVLLQMAASGLLPGIAGLSPLEAADLAHAEAQFVAKRVAMRALADGRNVILDISMAAVPSVMSWLAALRSGGYEIRGVFADLSVEEAVRQAAAAHRRGEEERRRGRGHGGRYIPPEAIRALADCGEDRPAIVPAGHADVWFPGGDVTDMIGAYQAGRLTLKDLAWEFAVRRWPAVPPACPPDMEKARSAVDDLEPFVPGSFDEVVLAYDLGQLSDPDYATLARAAAGASGR